VEILVHKVPIKVEIGGNQVEIWWKVVARLDKKE